MLMQLLLLRYVYCSSFLRCERNDTATLRFLLTQGFREGISLVRIIGIDSFVRFFLGFMSKDNHQVRKHGSTRRDLQSLDTRWSVWHDLEY
jgi:hypothetical protein